MSERTYVRVQWRAQELVLRVGRRNVYTDAMHLLDAAADEHGEATIHGVGSRYPVHEWQLHTEYRFDHTFNPIQMRQQRHVVWVDRTKRGATWKWKPTKHKHLPQWENVA